MNRKKINVTHRLKPAVADKRKKKHGHLICGVQCYAFRLAFRLAFVCNSIFTYPILYSHTCENREAEMTD